MSSLTQINACMLVGMIYSLAQASVTNDVAFTATYDGSTQRYVVILPDGFNPAQSNDVLICLHGHGSDRWQYVNVVRGETSSARDVARQNGMIFVSPDYRATTSWMGPAAEADMLQIIGDLKVQYKVKRMILSGGSMGASSSLTFTALHPELVDGVVALNGLADHVTYTNFQPYIAASFGGTKEDVPDEYYKRSAIYFPERFTMPLAVTAGGLDTVIPPQSVTNLAIAVQSNNPHVLLDFQVSRGHETDYTASLAAYRYVVGGEISPPAVVTSAEVIAYWDFSGDGLTDASGNFHRLINSGVVISNGVAVFNGGQTAFNTAGTLDLRGYNNLTIEFFMRTAGAAFPMMILEQTSQYFVNTGAFMVDVNEGGNAGQVMGGFCNNSAGTKLNLDSTPAGAASGGQWHHVAIVYDKAKTDAHRSMLYFDGVPQGLYANWTNDSFVSFCNGTLFIGSRGNSSMKYIGELDDVRISSGALATSQFLQAHTVGAPPVIAHWRFDEGAGLVDASGNGNTLVSGSGVVFTNGVARLNGSQAAFNTAGNLNLANWTNLTVEFFMRSAVTNLALIIEQTSAFYSNGGAFIVDVGDGGIGRVVGGFCTAASGPKLNLDSTPVNAAADGQWHHVAVVYDRSMTGAARSRLYFDGVAQGTFGSYADDTFTPFLNAKLYIGSRSNSTYKFSGELDDIRVTGTALQPGQFLKAPSTGLPRVIAYWPFSGRTPLSDVTGNGHTLTNVGVTFSQYAAVFDGAQTAFSTRPWTLNLRPYPALTVEYFIRTTSTNKPVVLEHSANFTTYRGGFVAVLNEFFPGQIESGISMPGINTYNIDSTAANAVTDGKWHHVALVYDPARSGDDRVRLFLDRVQQGKRTAGSNVSDADTFFLNDVLFIGAREKSNTKFIGELDDLKITGAALAPAEFMEKRTCDVGTLIIL